MEKHPLQFFKDLIEDSKAVILMRNKFLSQDADAPFFIENNWDGEYIIIDNPDSDEPGNHLTFYFKDQLTRGCVSEKKLFCNNLDIYILNEVDERATTIYLKKIFAEVNYLISKSKGNEAVQRYTVIVESLEGIKDHLINKYGLLDDIDKISEKAIDNPKLQWLGKINMLTTLFYDLSHENKSKNIPALIKASSKEIEDFILNNFVDQNGQPFERNTINTNLKPSKQKEKRAKGEITIEITKE